MSKIRFFVMAVILVAVFVIGVSYVEASNPRCPGNAMAHKACVNHREGNGEFHWIEIACSAVQSHKDHGDVEFTNLDHCEPATATPISPSPTPSPAATTPPSASPEPSPTGSPEPSPTASPTQTPTATQPSTTAVRPTDTPPAPTEQIPLPSPTATLGVSTSSPYPTILVPVGTPPIHIPVTGDESGSMPLKWVCGIGIILLALVLITAKQAGLWPFRR